MEGATQEGHPSLHHEVDNTTDGVVRPQDLDPEQFVTHAAYRAACIEARDRALDALTPSQAQAYANLRAVMNIRWLRSNLPHRDAAMMGTAESTDLGLCMPARFFFGEYE